jgi:hypothetical protein
MAHMGSNVDVGDSLSDLSGQRIPCDSAGFIFDLGEPGGNERGYIGVAMVQSDDGQPTWLKTASKSLMADDTVSVVWTADSGGKTQQLFKYTVQTDSPESLPSGT